MTVRRARAVIIAAIAKKAEKVKGKTYTIPKGRAAALPFRLSINLCIF